MAEDTDSRAAPSPSTEEWSNRALDTVDTVVDAVHDRVVRPALIAGRAVVFGILIAFLSLVVLVFLAIALVRLLDVYAFGGRVWASDALFGTVCAAAGLVLWRLRTHRRAAR
ncbi:MAG: hypothetical protein ACRDYB_06480 [Acidimicrobiales bacterium]